MSTTIEQLELEVQSSATSAVSGIDALASSLGKLKAAVKGGVGLTSVAKQLTTLNTALSSVSAGNAENLNKLANGLKTLSSCGSLKLSSSVATQITNIGSAIQSLNGTNFGALNSLTNALTPLANIGKSNLNSFISQLQRLPQAVQALNSVNIGSLGTQISQLVSALTPLTQMGKNNLTSFITQLQKLPQVMTALRSVDMGALASQIQQLANAFAPLATQMQSITNGFSALPTRLQRLIQQTNKLSAANSKASMSYVNLAAKVGMAYVALGRILRVVGSWIVKSNDYQESLNLFTVSMGKYANEAKAYAEKVSELMGIDPAEWLKQQGTFMNLVTGFGVAAEKAALMSKNLTQLGYDMASFFNMSIEDAMRKLQSAVAGELEPVRRVGYDLSQAALKKIALDSDNYAESMENVANAMSDAAISSFALSEGIKVSYNDMTQAEKSQLRYIALMKQITTVQGDMARTLETPANQLRILKAQINQAARSLGNIFIPILNAVLPYAIALAKVIRLVADAIARLFGFVLTEIDYSGLDSVVDDSGKIEDNLGGAAGEAKKIKNALLGIDELNIISPLESSGGGSGAGAGGGGGLGFELPTYDFLVGLTESRVDAIVEKIKGYLDEIGKRIKESGVIEAFERFKEALSNFKDSDFVKTMEKIIGILADGVLILTLDVVRDALNLIADILNGDLNRGVNDLKDLLVDITFDPLITIAEVLDTILGTDLAGWFRDVKQELKNLDLTQLPGFEKLQEAIEHLKDAFDKLKTAIQKFGNMLEETGAADAIKKVVVWLVSTSFDVLLQGIATAINIIADTLTIIADILNGDLYSGVNDLKNLLATITFEPLETVASIFDSIFGTDISGWLTDAEKAIEEFDLSGWFVDTGTAIGDFFTEDIPQFWEELKDAFEHPSFSISETWEKILQPIEDFDWKNFGYNVGQKVGGAVKEIGEAFKKFFTETLPEVWENVETAFETFFTETLPKFFTETIPELWETIKTAFVTFFTETLPEALDDIGQWFLDVGQAIWDGIVEGWNTAIKAISDFVDGFVQGFKDALGIHSPSTVFKAIGEDIVDGLLQGIEGFTNMMNTVKEWGASVIEWFTKGEDGKNIVDHFKEIGGNIIGGFKNKIDSDYTDTKSSITTWASKAKSWFSGTASSTAFADYANDIINGFKNKIGSAYTNAKSNMQTFASNVKSWFTGTVSYSSFYSIASDVISGFQKGIGTLYHTMKSTITSWGSSIIKWFQGVLGINSPSKVFYEMAGFSVEGFNNGFSFLGKSTKGVVSSWADSFTAVTPTMSFAVDTSALKYYDSGSFAKSVSANVASNTSVTATGFMEGMEEFYREYVEPTMAQMAADMRRQADKNEQTIVQIGNRTVSDAVTTQQKANGFVFAK